MINNCTFTMKIFFIQHLNLLLLILFGLGLSDNGLAEQRFYNPLASELVKALSGSHRSAANVARDVYRHPLETLHFFELQPDMTIVEIWPGAEGWYTEILAPLVRKKGKLYAAHFSAKSDIPFYTSSLDSFKKKLAAHPHIYNRVKLTTLQPPDQLDIAPAESVDRVLTFRNVHNWMKNGHDRLVFEAMFRALKPGGILGVVEHRGIPDKIQDPAATSGYVTEAYVISLAEKTGFETIGRSEINGNPKDTKNYPEGVWTLPPTLRLQKLDQDKYLNIGESDRMTLKFRKPGAPAKSPSIKP